MGKYIKLFETHSEYETYINGQDAILPNVSYCEDNNDVHYNPWTYAETYFTTIARENGTISFNILNNMGTDMITSFSYSTDNGNTWTTTANQDNKSENLVIDVTVNDGDVILWKGIATKLGFSDRKGSFFSSTCEFDAKGNIMSLIYGDNFKNQTTLEEPNIFAYLFSDYSYSSSNRKQCKIVNACDLILPATTLTENCYTEMFLDCVTLVTAPSLPSMTLSGYCYSYMFEGCTSLVTAPELPSTTLAAYCYFGMFAECTSLVNVSELPATTLANGCYDVMFSACTSLVNVPELPATTLTNACYWGMFSGCTSLVNAPELPATTMMLNCYNNLFSGCTSLVTAPELPATTLAQTCYCAMFRNCTSLVNAPELPATTLAVSCYNEMFNGCTSLVTAPELPATTLLYQCYYKMFNGCTSLNYIKAMFTTTPTGESPNNYTTDWVNGVSATGTFVKNSSATWNVSGVHGIPSGWTVETASE